MLQDLAPSFFCETLPFTLRVSQHGIEVHCKRLQTWITLEIVRCADTPSRSFCLSRRKHRTHFVPKRRIQPRATASSTVTPDNRGGQICKRPTPLQFVPRHMYCSVKHVGPTVHSFLWEQFNHLLPRHHAQRHWDVHPISITTSVARPPRIRLGAPKTRPSRSRVRCGCLCKSRYHQGQLTNNKLFELDVIPSWPPEQPT